MSIQYCSYNYLLLKFRSILYMFLFTVSWSKQMHALPKQSPTSNSYPLWSCLLLVMTSWTLVCFFQVTSFADDVFWLSFAHILIFLSTLLFPIMPPFLFLNLLHVYMICWNCRNCIMEWCNEKPECPLCRSAVTHSSLVCLYHSDF